MEVLAAKVFYDCDFILARQLVDESVGSRGGRYSRQDQGIMMVWQRSTKGRVSYSFLNKVKKHVRP